MKIGNLEVYGVIYKITNKINKKSYIGQTIQGFNGRYDSKGKCIERVYKRHKLFKEFGYPYNPHLLSSIEKYGFNNFDVNEVFDFAFSKDELNIKEQIYIKLFDSYKNGYNRNLGGGGNSGYDGLKGMDNPSSRQVVQLSLDGEYIKTWDYITQVERELGIGRTHITSVCTNVYGRKSTGGFMWMYLEDYDNNKDAVKSYSTDYKTESIIQLTLEGDFVKRYISAREAAEHNNISEKAIFSATSKKATSHRYEDYQWIKESEYDKTKDYKFIMPKKASPKPITMYDKNMNAIERFKSINEAYQKTGFYRYEISKNIKGEENKIKDFIFKYTYDLNYEE